MLVARICYLSVAVASLLLGPTLVDECVAKPIKLHAQPTIDQPTILTATLASNGTDTTVVFNRPMVAVDAAGFTLIVAAVPRNLTLAGGSGTDTFVFTSEVVYDDELVSLAYASAVGDAEDTFGNDLENAGISVTNNSTQMPTPDDTTPPEFVSATISNNGLDVDYVFDEAVAIANANGFTFTPSGGAAMLTYASGSGTTVVRMTSSRAIELDETATTQYTSTTGDVEDLYGNELATFGSTAVTNDSTYDSSDPYIPAPPETFTVDYDLPTGGTTYTPANAAEFNTALSSAVGGDVIVLQAGTTYTGNFRLRNWGEGADWIYIVSSGLASLPAEGERVGLSDAANMPRLIANSNAPLHSDFTAHHYRLAGIEIVMGARDGLTCCQFGYGGNFATGPTLESQLPHHITMDRCLIHSTSDAHRLRHGLMFNGKYMAIVDSCVANCKDSSDAMAIFVHNGTGPFKIVNNFLEGTGENIIFGGSDSAIANGVPSDIEIRGNHLFKRLTWKTVANSWGIKNNLELKNAQRVLITGNVLENNWTDAQTGVMVLFTVRNQSGGNPWAIVQDVNFENNILKNSRSFFNISGMDDLQISQRSQRIRIVNNLVTEPSKDNGSQPGFMQFTSPWYITVTHNSFLAPDDETNSPYAHIAFPVSTGPDYMICQNNIIVHGHYHTDWTKPTNLTEDNNVLAMNPLSSRYGFNKGSAFATQNSGDFMADPWPTAIEFVDFDGGDYHLDPSSPYAAGNASDATDGTDQGCDIDELETATAGSVSGVWP